MFGWTKWEKYLKRIREANMPGIDSSDFSKILELIKISGVTSKTQLLNELRANPAGYGNSIFGMPQNHAEWTSPRSFNAQKIYDLIKQIKKFLPE